MQERFTLFRWIPALVILFCMGAACIIFLTRVFFGAPFIPKLGDTIDIRADGVAILRLPTNPIQELEVNEDGQVIRYAYPIKPNVYTQIMLNPTEKREFDEFRTQWCQDVPTFRAVASNEPFYDLAFRCVGYNVKQAKIPIDMLPEIFSTILKRLPSP